MISGKYFSNGKFIAERRVFDSLDLCLNFLEKLINETNIDDNPVCFSFDFKNWSVIFQRQSNCIFLQVYMPENKDVGEEEGWYVLTDGSRILPMDEKLIITCFENCTELSNTHFLVLESEGVWFSQKLLVDRGVGAAGLDELSAFISLPEKRLSKNWVNIGLV